MRKSLKNILLLAGAIVLAVPALCAEEPPAAPADRPESRPGRRGDRAMMERMTKELGLNADQEARWKEIGRQERAALEAIRDDASLSRADKRAKARETNKSYAGQRRAVLTADQQKKFDGLRARMRERGPKRDQQDN